jgi:TPR repeat protein
MRLLRLASAFLVGALTGCATGPTADPWISGQAAYEHGDYDLALKDLSMAASAGHGAAYTLMGHLYRDGRGVARDGPEAARYYTRGAELGQCAAQLSLARMYHIGNESGRDEALAERWYREAAMRGYPWAQFALASFYENGVLVRKDDIQAYFWFSALAENPRKLSNGVGLAMQEVAIRTLLTIRERMTVEQFIEARELVEERRIGSELCADSAVVS